MRRSVSFLLGCLVVVLGAGCGGGGDTDTGGSTTSSYAYPTDASFCEALAKAECNDAVVTACYGSDQTSLPDDQKSCVTARAGRCNPDHLPYHPEHAEACIAAHAAAVQDATWTHDELAQIEEACLPVFSKQQSEGAACSVNTDCDATKDLRCVVKLGNIGGICAVPKVVTGGESCAAPAEVCADGFYCDPKVSHCLAYPQENEACSATTPCDPVFYCTDADTGVCTAKTKNGQACSLDEVCAGGFCVGANEHMTGKCSSTLQLALTSSSCDVYR